MDDNKPDSPAVKQVNRVAVIAPVVGAPDQTTRKGGKDDD